MSTPVNTSSTDSQMHNNIMAAGSKDRPPMLGPGRYSQWRSRFLWYIDTKPNGEGLGKSILSGPYVPSTVLVQVVAATEGNPTIQQHTTIETVLNMTPENKEHFLSEKEAIFLLLTGLDMHHSTGNLGSLLLDIGESMESYYSRFYKLMNELTRNNLQVTTMQVNVQFLQQLQPEWSRFVTVVKQSKEIDTISYHTLFDILKQYQNEVNDIRAERIAKSANPLALLAAAQPYSDNYYQAPKPQRSNATSSSTRPSASTRHKGKEIAKPVTPQSESVSEEDSDPEQAQRDKDMQKNLALLAKYFKRLYKPTNNNLRTSSNSRNKTEDTTPRYNNDNQSGQFGNQRTMTVAGVRETECRKPKRVKDYTYRKEKMMMCKQAEQGVPLQAEQADWLADTDKEIDEQELEAHYTFMAKIQEILPEESSSTEQPLEQVQNNDENNVFANERQHSENNTAECVDERVALANLIANLTLNTEENKMILKQLKKANTSLTKELKECKTNLDETEGFGGYEQYFQIQDYALWDIIENGNSFNPVARTTTNADGTSTSTIPGPVTTEEKVQKKNDVKTKRSGYQQKGRKPSQNDKTEHGMEKTVKNQGQRPKKSKSKSIQKNQHFIVRLVLLIVLLNVSDDHVYAFLANQPNGSQLVHEDLEQIHEDNLEEIDLKWQLALLSMRARRGNNFARECKDPRNQESRARNQDSSRRTVNVEDISSKAMVAIDGVGFDWSYMADEEVPTNLALMAFSDSKTVTVDTVNDGEQQLTIIVDGQTISITEAFIRRHLQLADADVAAKILADSSREKVKTYTRRRSTVNSRDSTVGGHFSTAEEVQVQEKQSDTIKRYQTLKKKPISVAQARKNMMIYLKTMAGYRMGYFKGMSYDEIRPIFEKEYNKIQTLFKKDTEVEKTKTKRIAEETLLQKVSRIKTAEASSLVKERFRSAEPTEDKERALWVELKRLFEPDKDDVLWKLQKYYYIL
ncbi:hypothetical protein Tco_0472967 [Tanacetum coccineum]